MFHVVDVLKPPFVPFSYEIFELETSIIIIGTIISRYCRFCDSLPLISYMTLTPGCVQSSVQWVKILLNLREPSVVW